MSDVTSIFTCYDTAEGIQLLNKKMKINVIKLNHQLEQNNTISDFMQCYSSNFMKQSNN